MARSSYSEPLHEKTFFQYVVILLIIGAFAFSLLAYLNTVYLRDTLVPKTIDVNDFLKKLTAHEEMGAFVGVSPLNIVQVNQNNIANLQTQINGLDSTFIGSFIVQYTDAIVIYNYANDEIKGTVSLGQQQAQLPADFNAKLNTHPELAGLENEQPVGGQIDEGSLNTLKQQFPDVYADAKVGDFLLRYETKLIIYDYNQDSIINSIDLG
jgi:hypothetical protein|tara:strand:- start:119 stop:748 length:630 start_codon:yes stop_codon:yes gene_type:complete